MKTLTPEIISALAVAMMIVGALIIVWVVRILEPHRESAHEKRIRQILSHSPAIEAAFDEEIAAQTKAKKRWLPERREWRRA